MNIIFLTLVRIADIENRGIYQDLMRKFRDEGHQVYIVTAAERRLGQKTSLVDSHGVKILNVKTLNVQKTNIVEKGIGTLLIECQYKAAIKKHLGDVKFDLITYSTPPITFTNVVKYLKRKNPKAISYLQLKDIFPQNAVDIGMFGEKSIFNWYLWVFPIFAVFLFIESSRKRLFVSDNTLYSYSFKNSLNKVLIYDELSFNNTNRISIYKK